MVATPTIRILCCGGTIDKVYFDAKSNFQVGEPQTAKVLTESHVTLGYTIQSLLQKDSLELTDEDRDLIRNTVCSVPESQILITHGTDTMAMTGKFLSEIPDKTIVLTGSMAPARFRDTDALFNIGFAFGVVQTLNAGVYLAMNGQIFLPDKVRKKC